MKTYRNLFVQITAFENLLSAARKAQRGKRFKRATALFNLNLEKELCRLQRRLRDGTYRHGGYHDFYIHDPKKRLISAAPYHDRVVHHALCNVIEPLFDRSFIHDSYACRKGKGTHAALERFKQFAPKNRLVLKCDIRKYFQSIDQAILLQIIGRTIKCPPTMALIAEIIGSRRDNSAAAYFPGDHLWSPYQRAKAIPIGNLTSQFFANLYLNGFDHFIKETLRCRYYIRYVDDFVIFGNDKALLNECLNQAQTYLAGLRLRLHPNKCRVYHLREGVRFLGFRHFENHRLLDKQNSLAMRRRLHRLQAAYRQGQVELEEIRTRIESWISHARYGNTFRLRERLLGAVVFQRDRV